MSQTISRDLALDRIKAALKALYGQRLEKTLLYGSRARGDHQPDSDYDILVVLDGVIDDRTEAERLARLSSDLTWETADSANPVAASIRAVTADQIEARTGFMHNVRREAVAI